ncbi:MAG: Crp/Fnr family transcriptional regulator [Acidobacteria bacterium]|nr:Crp/Fnr family transcriptional regulator [Acidobacteriota bacterium]
MASAIDKVKLSRGYLPAVDLFRDFTEEEVREVERVTVLQRFEKGRLLYTPGETGEALFLLRPGAVQIYRMSAEGRKLVIAHLLPYAFFGAMSCIGQGMYDAYAEAIEDCEVIMMNCADLERLLISKPRVALRILEAFGKRVIEAEQQLEDIAFKGLVARLASLLLREADENGEVRGLSHRDIAERLGIYRETATNGLKELKAAGIISIARKRIHITDPARLRLVAEE